MVLCLVLIIVGLENHLQCSLVNGSVASNLDHWSVVISNTTMTYLMATLYNLWEEKIFDMATLALGMPLSSWTCQLWIIVYFYIPDISAITETRK